MRRDKTSGAVTTLAAADWNAVLSVNLTGATLMAREVVARMVKAERPGVLVNLSSISGLVGTPRRAAYAASKGAIDAATRSLAIELGPSGIRVNSAADSTR